MTKNNNKIYPNKLLERPPIERTPAGLRLSSPSALPQRVVAVDSGQPSPLQSVALSLNPDLIINKLFILSDSVMTISFLYLSLSSYNYQVLYQLTKMEMLIVLLKFVTYFCMLAGGVFLVGLDKFSPIILFSNSHAQCHKSTYYSKDRTNYSFRPLLILFLLLGNSPEEAGGRMQTSIINLALNKTTKCMNTIKN